MDEELIAQLKDLLDPQLARWAQDPPPRGPVSRAVADLETVREGLVRWQRFGEREKTFLAQALKFMKAAESAEDKTFVADVKRWKKAWDNRPLPNESALGELLESRVRELAAGQASVDTHLVDGGEATSMPNIRWNFYKVFEEHRGKGAVAVVSQKNNLSLFSDSGEILDRLFKQLNKRLTKELGKPTGGSKDKQFVAGRVRLSASRQTTAGNDAYPFAKQQLSYSTSGGKLQILG